MAYSEKTLNGDMIVVDLVLNSRYADSEVKSLMLRIKDVLPAYLIPSKINIVDCLPRNAFGKIVRYKREVI